MSNTDAYALQRSDLNGFLFAEIGVEGSGMTLSVISALARLGVDPWQEAGRLAKLPRTAAVDGLARIISAMPASLWPLPAATAIATRLVALLPRHDGNPLPAAVQVVAAQVPPATRWLIAAALLAALAVGLAFWFTGGQEGVQPGFEPVLSIIPRAAPAPPGAIKVPPTNN